MLYFILTICFVCGFSFVLGFFPLEWESRPTLKSFGYELPKAVKKDKFSFIRAISMFNKPFCQGLIRQRLMKDLVMARVPIAPEEFFLAKEVIMVAVLAATYPFIKPDMITFWVLMSFTTGYMAPEYWLKGKINHVKAVMTKEMPDAIDLLGLCVNAGLDFMLALKWVVEKSPPSIIVAELNVLLQEINVGKTRRDALRDMAAKYAIPEIASFSRTLIQADKMGTSVAEALNRLSEDMRLSRFRRGEQMAMKAPLKLLVPLLLFIFPVVGVLVAGPIFLQFIETSPLQGLAK